MAALIAAEGRRSMLVYARDALLFGACYLALDWASTVYPLGPFYITPWNPPPALCIVWMLLGGLHYAPVVFLATLAGDLLVHKTAGGVAVSVVTSFILSAGYTGIAAVLRLRFGFEGRLDDMRHLWIFIATTAVGAAVIGIVYVGVLGATGFLFRDSFAGVTFRFWLGDTVGVVVTAPLLMVAADPERRRRLLQSCRKPETLLQFGVLLAMVVFMFRSGAAPERQFYLLFLPLIWIASRNGLSGAVVGSCMVQAGVVVGAQVGSLQALTVVELQALVTALTLTSLSLGIIVDERERVLEDLKRSLRLAAASEMAGAIAHEINQPLSAMHNYGSACQLMLRGRDGAAHSDLGITVDKMVQESKRAAEVVRRLRELFRRGSVQLEPVKVSVLLERANAIGGELSRAEGVTFQVDSSDGAQTLLVDRLQIELVLRNLIANAFDAVASMPAGKREVTVLTRMLKGGRILFRVTDSGTGMSPLAQQHLFEPLSATSKASGMGIGLAISRTIADAHGGSLSLSDRRHGQFDLVLPTGTDDE